MGLVGDVLGVGLLAAGAGVLLWAVRTKVEAPRAWIVPSLSGVVAGGSF